MDDVINAFETGTPGEQNSQNETEKLSAVQLRKDIKRFCEFSSFYSIKH